MTDTPPSILSHVSVGTNDYDRTVAFYDAVLGAVGIKKVMEHPGAAAYGRAFPEFWVQTPMDGKPASVSNGTHIGFFMADKKEVHAFYDAALKAGATDDGAPGPRPLYGAPYYGCFIRDLDGHKIEAVYWDTSLQEEAS